MRLFWLTALGISAIVGVAPRRAFRLAQNALALSLCAAFILVCAAARRLRRPAPRP